MGLINAYLEAEIRSFLHFAIDQRMVSLIVRTVFSLGSSI